VIVLARRRGSFSAIGLGRRCACGRLRQRGGRSGGNGGGGGGGVDVGRVGGIIRVRQRRLERDLEREEARGEITWRRTDSDISSSTSRRGGEFRIQRRRG